MALDKILWLLSIYLILSEDFFFICYFSTCSMVWATAYRFCTRSACSIKKESHVQTTGTKCLLLAHTLNTMKPRSVFKPHLIEMFLLFYLQAFISLAYYTLHVVVIEDWRLPFVIQIKLKPTASYLYLLLRPFLVQLGLKMILIPHFPTQTY